MKRMSDYAVASEQALKELGLASREPKVLYAPIDYMLGGGGKRLRPSLVMMSAEAFGAPEGEALRAAIGMEMFHNFTLLHDDVMDKSDKRHGRATVHVKWDENVAILSGDTMLTLATDLVSQVPDKALRPVLKAFNDMAIEVYEGQALDMEFETTDEVSVEDYIAMVGKKTGALLGASAQIGALIAGADEKTAGEMYSFGYNLGIAFQVRDDYLDVYGDEATFGKPIGGDINQGKKTFLLLKGYERGGSQGEALRIGMQLPEGERRVATVTNLYTKMGMPKECEDAIQAYSNKALQSLRRARLGEEAFEAFKKLTLKMTGRQK